jgi:hypothetical protein
MVLTSSPTPSLDPPPPSPSPLYPSFAAFKLDLIPKGVLRQINSRHAAPRLCPSEGTPTIFLAVCSGRRAVLLQRLCGGSLPCSGKAVAGAAVEDKQNGAILVVLVVIVVIFASVKAIALGWAGRRLHVPATVINSSTTNSSANLLQMHW